MEAATKQERVKKNKMWGLKWLREFGINQNSKANNEKL